MASLNIQETYGEDPYLTSQMARAFVMGLQGEHERYIRVGAACKHFAAHSGPEHDPISRLKFDAMVSISMRYNHSQIKETPDHLKRREIHKTWDFSFQQSWSCSAL